MCHLLVGQSVERLGFHLGGGQCAVGTCHAHEDDDLVSAGSNEGCQRRRQYHGGALDGLAGLLAHHLSHLQNHQSVEDTHADGTVTIRKMTTE